MREEVERQREDDRRGNAGVVRSGDGDEQPDHRDHRKLGQRPGDAPCPADYRLSRLCNGIVLKPGKQRAEREAVKAADEAEIEGQVHMTVEKASRNNGAVTAAATNHIQARQPVAKTTPANSR
ncbi:hypothetical protein [Mesorhizobium tamadayense]|uniref:hypothetical protein n=1 Tax=Mesorhizobium tamadayense TaxID=425306 RepID=UPI001FDF01C0|nr:hypothetical protein [Mesorhizobium tamadayense]